MPSTATVARILLGLLFVVIAASGFFSIAHPPEAPPGLAGAFQNALFGSRYVLFIDAIELLAGVCLLADRYVPLALVTLAAIIANIVAFHVTMAPAGLPIAIAVAAVWTLVALQHRPSLAPSLVARPALAARGVGRGDVTSRSEATGPAR